MTSINFINMIGNNKLKDMSHYLISAKFDDNPRSIILEVRKDMNPKVDEIYNFGGKSYPCTEILNLRQDIYTIRVRGLKFELINFNKILKDAFNKKG